MEHDTKTRKSSLFFGLQAVAPALCPPTRRYVIAVHSRLEERMLTFACYALHSPVAYG